MKMKKLSIFLASILMFSLAGCGQSPVSSSSGSIHPSDSGSSVAISDSAESIVAESKQATPAFNQEQFETFMGLMSDFIPKPFASTEELKNHDMFFGLLLVAQQYADWQGKTYSVDENSNICHFPLNELRHMSQTIFGFEMNFEPYIDNSYFKRNGYPMDYYDQSTNVFVIALVGGGFYPEGSTDGFYYKKTVSTDIKGDSLVVVSDIIFYPDSAGQLGVEGIPKTATFHFKMIEENGVTYYQFVSSEF